MYAIGRYVQKYTKITAKLLNVTMTRYASITTSTNNRVS